MSLAIAPAFLLVVRGLMSIIFRDRLEHETFALFVGQNAALASHTLRDQDSHHARWPYHASGMKLNELHVDEFSARLICERVSISSIFPAVACDFVGATDPTGGQHDCFRSKDFETASLAFITKRANHAFSVL